MVVKAHQQMVVPAEKKREKQMVHIKIDSICFFIIYA